MLVIPNAREGPLQRQSALRNYILFAEGTAVLVQGAVGMERLA